MDPCVFFSSTSDREQNHSQLRSMVYFHLWFDRVGHYDEHRNDHQGFFFFVHSNDCLYEIHSFDRGLRPTICATEQEIVGKLEHQWTTKPKEWKSVRSYHDLTHMNVFERTLSTFFFIDKSTSTTPFSYEKITIIPVDM